MSVARDYDAMRRTVYGEARGQHYDGQIAVAWVILNRAQHPTTNWWGRGIEGVCFKEKQFSCWNPGDPNAGLCRVANENLPSFLKASAAAAAVMLGLAPDPTNGATHYHTIAAPRPDITWPPVWAKNMITTAEIGAHRFLKEK
jgi:N-acetylmuramoyl-L-alanine amidase